MRLLLPILLLAFSGQARADLQEANQALAAKDYPTAIAAYQEVLSKEPDNLVALRQLGTAYYDGGDKPRSLGVYEAAALKQPGDLAIQRFVASLKGQGVIAVPYTQPTSTAAAATAAPTQYGIRLGLGYGLPSTLTSLGTDEGTGGSYSFGMGGGLTTGGEFLWAFHPQMELGVGVQFIGNNASFSSKDYSGTQENTHKVDSSVTPLELTLYAILPASAKWNWVLGLGPSLALGGDYRSTEDAKAGGSITTKRILKADLDLGLGYHGLLGVEYQVSRAISILAGLDLEAIQLSRSKDTISTASTSPGGTFVSEEEVDYVDSPPKLKASTTTVNGTVTATDDGVTVSSYDSATRKTTTKKTVGKTSTVDFTHLAPFLKVTLRF